MAEGTGVGSIFLDLVVRDTIEKQVQNLANKGQAAAQQAFSGMEKAAERAANNAAASASKTTQAVSESVEAASRRISSSLGGAFNKSVALAQARLKELETQLARVTADRKEASVVGDDKATQRLMAQQMWLYDQVQAARERLAIHVQAAAEKQAASEIAAAQKTTASIGAEAAKRQATVSQSHTSADPPIATQQASVWQRLVSLASGFKNAASQAFSVAGKLVGNLTGKIASLTKRFKTAGSATGRFGSMLREIASGALIFNGISLALRNMTSCISKAVSSTSQMKTALANLKGAAATAAAPILEVLTPALTALANAAATVFSYLSRLISFFTGKSTAAMASAARKFTAAAGTAKKAAAGLAGFDEIEKAGGSDSGGGAGSSGYNYDFQGESPFLDSILAAVKAGQWGQVGIIVAQKLNDSVAKISWPDIQEKAQSWAQGIADTINGFVGALDFGAISQSLSSGLNTVLLTIAEFVRSLDGQKIGRAIVELVASIDWHGLLESLGAGISAVCAALPELIRGLLEGAWSEAVEWWKDTAYQDGQFTIQGLIDGITEAITLHTPLGLMQELGKHVIQGLIDGICNAFADVWKSIENYFAEYIQWAEDEGLSIADGIVVGFFTGIAQAAANICTWIYDNLIEPVIESAKDALGIHSPSRVFADIGKNLVLGLLKGITSVWKRITKYLKKAFDDLEDQFSAAWEDIQSVVEDVVESIKEKISSGFEAVKNTVETILNAIKTTISDIWDRIITTVSSVVENIKRKISAGFEKVKTTVSTIFNAVWSIISSIWNSITSTISNVVDGIKEKVSTGFEKVKTTTATIFDAVGTTVSNIWNRITTTISNVVDGIKEKVSNAFTAVKNTVTTIFEAVKSVVGNIWNGINSTIRGVINGIIGAINGMISGITTGINTVIRALNKLSFKVPDWLANVPGAAGIAGKTFGFNISTISAPRIPMLADGGVITQPTLAMMGEYTGARSNPEIVAPQSIMEETVAGVMRELVEKNQQSLENVIGILREILEAVLGIEIDGEILSRAVENHNRKMAVVKGGST